jgi:hypothetical protein
LETQLTEMKRAASAPPSFLGAVCGGGEPLGGARTAKLPGDPGTGQPALAMTAQPGYGPEGSSAAAPAPGAGLTGGGFLQSAATAAAGIAGGGRSSRASGRFWPSRRPRITGNQRVAPNLGETVLRNRDGAEAGASGGGSTERARRSR